MKHLLSITIILLGFTCIFAQDYFPFPQGQRSFWKSGDQVTQYYNDYQEEIGVNEHLLLFGAEYLYPEGPCLDSLIGFFFTDESMYSNPVSLFPPQVDSMLLSEGRLYSFGQPSPYFNLDATLGESCMTPAPQSLYGWVATDEQVGFTHRFEDYFDLAVGSVFKYTSIDCDFLCNNIIRNFIVNSMIDDSGLTYTVHRHSEIVKLSHESDPDPNLIDTIYYTYDTVEIHFPRAEFIPDLLGTPAFFFMKMN